MTTRYLSRTEVAERIGVQPDTLGRYYLPEPDALIGITRGWLPSTIDGWNASRPGRGGAVGGLRPCWSVSLLPGLAAMRQERSVGRLDYH
jgi:hypothetical protein